MKLTAIFTLALLLTAVPSFNAGSEEISGHALAQKVFDRDRGNDSLSTAQMVLVNKAGNKRARQFTSSRILEGELESQMIRFTSPADIDGTGFLTIEKPGWETEQFLYLPALRRTRRIVSSQKSQKFVNSDFTYEDMERHPVDDYEYRITGSKEISGMDCYELETRPKEGVNSQYALTISYISKQSLVPVLVKYFDEKEQHIKTYTVMKLEQIQGIWTESMASMANLKEGHKTYIKILNISYNKGIDPQTISRKELENY